MSKKNEGGAGKGLVQRSIYDLEFEKKNAAKLVTSSGEMGFASLHHHSTFSYLDGYGIPEDHVKRAAELGMPAMALTEHGNMCSHPRFERAAHASGIKPIFGCELYCGPTDESKRVKRKNHLTVLAEDDGGYQNLLHLVERSYSEGFYYEATVSGQMLAEQKKGLIVLSGCNGSLLATSLVGGKNIKEDEASLERGLKVARNFKRTFGDRYFLEVQPFPELAKTCAINVSLEEISRKTGIELVVSGDVHYMLKEHSEMQQILHNIRGGSRQTMEQLGASWGYDVSLGVPTGETLLFKRLRATGLSAKAARQAIANSLVIAGMCNVTLPKAPKLRFPVAEGEDSVEVWREWLREGWKFRGCNRLPKAERERYLKRLKREMKTIEDKDFVDYFLVVSDAVRWAKDHGIPVGPARGSAAGSLACYLLRITEVNPMLFPLLVFERFVDPSREDEPDIDLDFDDERRDEVRQYLVRKYGDDKVANLGTFIYYKSKNALDDLARVYRVPQWEVDKVKSLLIERSSGDLRATATIEDTAEMFDEVRDVFERYPDLKKAMKLEGNIKGMGVHAAGLVMSNQPIRELVPIHQRTLHGKEISVAAIDKYDSEIMGLLKMDFLGLSTMGLFRHALGALGLTMQDLYDIPLDDPVTLQGFAENDVVGIFQYDGQATKDIASTIHPETFQEVYHINALCRPGPLHNGATAAYINVKNGLAEPRKLHPLYDAITKDTNYELVYQEQILRIVREVGGFDWTASAYIRRLISRRMGEQEFNRQKGKFMEGALARGLDEDTAETIWRRCITAGAYAFNAAHAVSYGYIAYWTMWLKRRHPKEFYAAALRKYPDKQAKLLRDAAMPPRGVTRNPITVQPPDPRLSGMSWRPTKTGVRAGFLEIPGVGEKTALAIMDYRKELKQRGERLAWPDLIHVKGIGPKTITSIQEFVNKDDPHNVTKLRRTLDAVRKAIAADDLGRAIPMPTHVAEDIPYQAGVELEVVWLGVFLKRNLRDLFEYSLSKKGVELDPDTVKRPDLREWVVAFAEDDTETTYVTFNRFDYPKFKDRIWNLQLGHDIVMVKGVKRKFLNKRDILVKEMWVIEP